MSKPEMSDLPPEVLEGIFNATDLKAKKELRLVCKSWQRIIDNSQLVNFCIRNMRTMAHLNTFLDSSVKEFYLVQMEFTWGVKFPKYLLKDGFNFNSHKIKELVFAKPSYKRNTPYAHTIGDSQVLKFFINFLKSGCHGVEHLNIHSGIMSNFIVSDLERALTRCCAPCNTVQILSLAVSPLETDEEHCQDFCFAPLHAFLKLANIPNLNNVRFEVKPNWYYYDDSEEFHCSALIDIIVEICKFLLRYKATLRHVFLLFDYAHYRVDLEKHLTFMEAQGPLELESFTLVVDDTKKDTLGYIATACTAGPAKLRTFGYSSNKYTLGSKHMALPNREKDRLERILLENGSTIEDLTLDMTIVNFNLFRHCPNLKTLKFGEVQGMIFEGSPSKFPNITTLRVQNKYCLKPEFVNWMLDHCPNLTFLEIGKHRNACGYLLEIRSILLKFDKLKEILLFGDPHNFRHVEVNSRRGFFKCVRKIHPSTSVPYLSILVEKA